MPARLARRHAMLFSGCLFWRSSASVVVLDHGAGFVRHVTDVHELSSCAALCWPGPQAMVARSSPLASRCLGHGRRRLHPFPSNLRQLALALLLLAVPQAKLQEDIIVGNCVRVSSDIYTIILVSFRGSYNLYVYSQSYARRFLCYRKLHRDGSLLFAIGKAPKGYRRQGDYHRHVCRCGQREAELLSITSSQCAAKHLECEAEHLGGLEIDQNISSSLLAAAMTIGRLICSFQRQRPHRKLRGPDGPRTCGPAANQARADVLINLKAAKVLGLTFQMLCSRTAMR